MLPRPTRRAFIGAAALAPALGLAAWRPVREGLPLDPPPVKTATLAIVVTLLTAAGEHLAPFVPSGTTLSVLGIFGLILVTLHMERRAAR